MACSTGVENLMGKMSLEQDCIFEMTWRGDGFRFFFKCEIVDKAEFEKTKTYWYGSLCKEKKEGLEYYHFVDACFNKSRGECWDPQSCEDVVRLFTQFFDEDCCMIDAYSDDFPRVHPRVALKVCSSVGEFVFNVPFYFLLEDGEARRLFENCLMHYLVKVLYKDDVEKHRKMWGYSTVSTLDYLRDQLYVPFYLRFKHPRSWIKYKEDQWWYPRLFS